MPDTKNAKAVVHISGTLLRRTWYGREMLSCVVVRPGGPDRDKKAYVVNQVRFKGPSELKFSAKPRGESENATLDSGHGFIGTLPGFDNAILIYLEAEEADIEVQPQSGDDYIPFLQLKEKVFASKSRILVLDPMKENNC
jgi:hypothetical protein